MAMEYYLNVDFYDNAMDNFLAKMGQINATYETLSQEDKALVDTYLGTAMEKYNRLYQINKNGANADKNEYEALFNELLQAIQDFDRLASAMINSETGEINGAIMGATVSAFERARTLVNQIMATGNEDIIVLFTTMQMSVGEDKQMSLDSAFLELRQYFVNLMHNISFTVEREDGTQDALYAWDVYYSGDVQDIMAAAYYVIMMQYDGKTDFDVNTVLAVMKAYRDSLVDHTESMTLFMTFHADELYYAGLEAFFSQVLSAEEMELARKLMEAEQECTTYAADLDDEQKKEAFMAVMAEVIALREALTELDNFNTYLANLYSFYLTQYNALVEGV